ncbi:NAD-dependent epimerase/dehydratase family protein [Yinghuangia sp. YIM S09857]|uniref:NAD-dependent epimerase/dehydratase family protein n=1 Tax=Yinghuangia sp. YIM S09857 TaxID=3436929 RepID=UPI003F53DFA6
MGDNQAVDGSSHDSDRRVLVTGGAGFLGLAVVRRLRSTGFPVVVVDDGSGGTLGRLDGLADDPGVRVVRTDICSRAEMAELHGRERPWGVVHLAARHFLPTCDDDPRGTVRANLLGTRSLIRAWQRHVPERFVLASTADVYAHSVRRACETAPVVPESVYGRSKLAAEELVRGAAVQYGCRLTVVRPFNIYGPNPTTPHLIPAVCEQLDGEEPVFLGDLSTVRDYVYVECAAAAVAGLLLSDDGSGTYNIGTGVPTSGHELIDVIGRARGRQIDVRLDPARLRRVERQAIFADPSRLHETLPDWRPIPLAQGIVRVLDARPAFA